MNTFNHQWAKSFQKLEEWMNQHQVNEIECLVPDFTGVARGKILPRNKFTEDRGIRLPNVILSTTVTGNYPEDERIEPYISLIDTDMLLVPDPSTICAVPWVTDPTAQVIHDCYDQQGEPILYSPRNVLKKILKLYQKQGWSPVCAPEVEFYLVEKNEDPDIPLKPPIGRSGRSETSRQHYSIDAVNEFDPLFEDLYDYCEAMALNLDTLIHEMGAGQMEVNFMHGEPLWMADNVFYFKRVTREVALRHGMYATFMAKPLTYEPGSAMHIHQSIKDAETGQNIFSEADGSPSPLFYYFIGGLQKYMPHAAVLYAPYVNSYRRLSLSSSESLNTCWGVDNRSVGFRVPFSTPEARRIENRLPGADANPYIAIAVTLACGYLGMMERIEPTEETKTPAWKSESHLPRNLNEAVNLLSECPALENILTPSFCAIYREVKMAEFHEFMTMITPWERDHLLLRV